MTCSEVGTLDRERRSSVVMADGKAASAFWGAGIMNLGRFRSPAIDQSGRQQQQSSNWCRGSCA
jgi:hypothetical protein